MLSVIYNSDALLLVPLAITETEVKDASCT